MKFNYKTRSDNGAIVNGSIEAASKAAVEEYLFSKNLNIVSIEEESKFSIRALSEVNIGGIPLKEKVIFMRQLATMVSAGLTISYALTILAEQAVNPYFKSTLKKVVNDVEGGMSFSKSLSSYDGVFDSVTISLISAGEESGQLEKILRVLAKELEKKSKLNSKVKSALIYPALIVVVIIVVVILLMTVLVPSVRNLYADLGAEDKIPGITLFVIAMSDGLVNYWYLIILIIAIIGIGFKLYYDTLDGKRTVHKILLKIPAIGTILQNIELAQFTRVLALLLSSGMVVTDALRLTSSSMFNILFQEAVKSSIKDIEKGVSLSMPIARSDVFPDIISKMIAVGEETGALDAVLKKMAKYYEDEVDVATSNLSSIIEPLMLIVMGGIVGFIAAAVYMPLFSIGNALS